MHEYSACPAQNTDAAPERSHDDSSGFTAQYDPTGSFQDASNRSSLDLSLEVPQDIPRSPTPPAQDESSRARASLTSLKAHGSSKKKLIKPLIGSYSRWKASRRLQTTVIGFYCLALVCAVLHCWFFVYLDGRVYSEGVAVSTKSTTIPQSYVTTISLLFTTAFRAALFASIGICYTQQLWATLRERVLTVDLIEDLFQIQTNAFHLLSPGLYIKTPILAAVALFSWLAPIAMVYPPGALVVELNALSVDAKFNVSVFHVQNPMEDTNYVSNIWCRAVHLRVQSSGPISFPDDAPHLKECYSRWESVDSKYITRTSLMSGEIASLTQPVDGNSSYSIDFWGPTLDCEVINTTIDTPLFQSDLIVGNQRSTWTPGAWMLANFGPTCELRSSEDPLYKLENTTLSYRFADYQSQYRYYPCLDSAKVNETSDTEAGYIELPDSGLHFQIPTKETVCHTKIVRYYIDVFHSAGKQKISHRIEDQESLPAYASEFANYTGTWEQWVQSSDALQIFHDFANNLNRSASMGSRLSFPYPNMTEPEPYTTENGTTVDICMTQVWGIAGEIREESDIWPLSVFELRDPVTIASKWEPCPQFDVALAKELLLNSTISALSLNKRFQIVDGTTSRTFNLYRFQSKLAFFLPYGLSLGLSIPIIALGLFAFYKRNQGVSAITGGFLQILVTTTGRGSLEGVIAKGRSTFGGHENISRELRETKIRFGELIEANGGDSEQSLVLEPRPNWQGYQPNIDDTVQREQDSQQYGLKMASAVELTEKPGPTVVRNGFGLAHEVQSLRRRPV